MPQTKHLLVWIQLWNLGCQNTPWEVTGGSKSHSGAGDVTFLKLYIVIVPDGVLHTDNDFCLWIFYLLTAYLGAADLSGVNPSHTLSLIYPRDYTSGCVNFL